MKILQLPKNSHNSPKPVPSGDPNAVSAAVYAAALHLSGEYGMLLKIKDVCRLLGIASPKTVRRKVRAGILPAPNCDGDYSLIEVLKATTGFDERRKYELTQAEQNQVNDTLSKILPPELTLR